MIIEKIINILEEIKELDEFFQYNPKYLEDFNTIIKTLKQLPRKGEWLRMSDEQKDYRYQCSCCGNVVHYNDKMNLYTFNRWCGRCGSDNGRKGEVKE